MFTALTTRTSQKALTALAGGAVAVYAFGNQYHESSSSKSPQMTLLDAAKDNNLAKWATKWQQGTTSWHIPAINNALLMHQHLLFPGDHHCRVLVPLCGKSADLAYLARLRTDVIQHVVGVDGVEQALEEFAKENVDLGLQKTKPAWFCWSRREFPKEMQVWKGPVLSLVCGNFFKFQSKHQFDAVWDRGSLVALEPSLRDDYIQVIRRSLRPGGRILLSAIVRTNGDATTGPPFSIDAREIQRLFTNKTEWVESVTLLEVKPYNLKKNNPNASKQWYEKIQEKAQKVVDEAQEKPPAVMEYVYLIQTKK